MAFPLPRRLKAPAVNRLRSRASIAHYSGLKQKALFAPGSVSQHLNEAAGLNASPRSPRQGGVRRCKRSEPCDDSASHIKLKEARDAPTNIRNVASTDIWFWSRRGCNRGRSQRTVCRSLAVLVLAAGCVRHRHRSDTALGAALGSSLACHLCRRRGNGDRECGRGQSRLSGPAASASRAD